MEKCATKECPGGSTCGSYPLMFAHLLPRFLLLSCTLTALFACPAPLHADVKLPAIFGDHMVLQQDSKIPVWGWAAPGENVGVKLGKQSAKTQAGPDGKWRVDLKPIAHSATPLTLTVKGKNTLKFEDVLVGDVWICSGQSNMGFSLWHVNNAQEEINNAKYPGIRMFVVDAQFRPVPQENCSGHWIVCQPDQVGVQGFSAVGYFFARELHRKLHFPIGMINSSVGATDAELWISLAGIKQLTQFQTDVQKAEAYANEFTAKLPEYGATMADYDQQLADFNKAQQAQEDAWHAKIDAEDPGMKESWMKSGALSEEKTFTLPDDYSHPSLGSYLGTVWCHKEVKIPDAWIGKPLELHLGVIDEADETYVNGQKVGFTWYGMPDFSMVRRIYAVPASLVKGNTVSVIVRMVNRFGELGFFGPENEMCLVCKETGGASVALSGAWAYKLGAAWTKTDLPKSIPSPKEPWTTRVAGSLYNGMIHPLVPYAIKGAIWYQGENNHARPIPYRELLPGLIASWRNAWGEGDFPFYIVQIANCGKAAVVEKKSMAELREAQAITAQNGKNTGLAVILDGVPEGHPTHKEVVGKRLALQAFAKTYGQTLVFDGPTYQEMKIEGNRVHLSFRSAKGLQTRKTPNTAALPEGEALGFAIAGEDKVFHAAQARMEGESVVVWSDKVPNPVTVRYAWADNPIANLYNGEGLPMGPFRTDQWSSEEIGVAKE